MKDREEEPQEKPGLHASHDSDSKKYTHPAFGQISASRVGSQPGVTMYGTDFRHQNYISIRVHRSELNRDLSRDWPFARETLLELRMSEAQWATFVSSLNTGGGTQCTLEFVDGEYMPDIPMRKQQDVARKELGNRVRELAGLVRQTIDEINGELGRSVSGVKKEAMMRHLEKLEREVRSNLPFMEESFARQMEKSVEHAKVEVNAYIHGAVQRAGLDALGVAPVLQLNPGEEAPADSE